MTICVINMPHGDEHASGDDSQNIKNTKWKYSVEKHKMHGDKQWGGNMCDLLAPLELTVVTGKN